MRMTPTISWQRVPINRLVFWMPGKVTYSKHDPALLLSFFRLRFLFIAPNALDVISQ